MFRDGHFLGLPVLVGHEAGLLISCIESQISMHVAWANCTRHGHTIDH